MKVKGQARELSGVGLGPECWFSHPLGSPSSPLAWLTNTAGGFEGHISRLGSPPLPLGEAEQGRAGSDACWEGPWFQRRSRSQGGPTPPGSPPGTRLSQSGTRREAPQPAPGPTGPAPG